MIIIGISGKKGSGKDTFALLLEDLFRKQEIKVITKAFADKLKECCAVISGQFEWIFYNQNAKNKKAGPFLNITNRELMQKFGDLTRQLDPNIWIKLVLEPDYKTNPDVLIITDVRFKNEAKAIKDKGGILIRMESDRSKEDNHKSETDLDDYNNFDLVINNNIGVSIKELQAKAKDIITYIKNKKFS